MENTTKTMTAMTPAFAMSSLGHRCVKPAAAAAAAYAAVAIVRVKGDSWGSHAWRPLTS